MDNYWQECLEQFKEALVAEKEQDEINDSQIKLLLEEIKYCEEKVQNG